MEFEIHYARASLKCSMGNQCFLSRVQSLRSSWWHACIHTSTRKSNPGVPATTSRCSSWLVAKRDPATHAPKSCPSTDFCSKCYSKTFRWYRFMGHWFADQPQVKPKTAHSSFFLRRLAGSPPACSSPLAALALALAFPCASLGLGRTLFSFLFFASFLSFLSFFSLGSKGLQQTRLQS